MSRAGRMACGGFAAIGSVLLMTMVAATARAATTETIVFLRHGEKPAAGLGQLSCKGLNRALALPRVIAEQFGRPQALFAPDPSVRKDDGGTSYDYIRPLATIEPTAIALGLPVDTRFGFADIEQLQARLEDDATNNSTVLVAWEHKQIVKLARQLISAHGGDPKQVPRWAGDDFDSFYVVTIRRDRATSSASFERKTEGLDGRSEVCPS
jgi:broad specificity phosphatase PhoE